MKKNLARVSPLKAGIVFGVFNAGFALVLVPFMMLPTVLSLGGDGGIFAALGIGFAILAPVIYGAMGFLMGAVMAFIYNLVAKFTGGFEIELEDVA